MTHEVYIDLSDENMNIYFDTCNRERILESKVVNNNLTPDEKEDLERLLEKMDDGHYITLYADFRDYVDVDDDDDGGYDAGYDARVEEEEEENTRIKSIHGPLIQKLLQMRDGWGKHAHNRYLNQEEIDQILNLIRLENDL